MVLVTALLPLRHSRLSAALSFFHHGGFRLLYAHLLCLLSCLHAIAQHCKVRFGRRGLRAHTTYWELPGSGARYAPAQEVRAAGPLALSGRKQMQ